MSAGEGTAEAGEASDGGDAGWRRREKPATTSERAKPVAVGKAGDGGRAGEAGGGAGDGGRRAVREAEGNRQP
ncbi:hypothetical protein GUJ93_ZPchr0010g7255 [Zizania palustris]|uniref:Uncharacterized protein n=1 Tax=Zizania palustris TaxID=103762 RepID=A0A8J5WAK8_ZIZPA|nr:hypothetical protein GUJ93_ZPchr0010g7255 [Zizania palustris]